jgi:4-hydroxy-tetrahydrodipicolinate synthase
VRDLAHRLARLFDLFVEASSVRVVYAIVNQLGLSNAQPPRPMLPVSQDVARRVGEALETLRLV